MQNSYHPRFWYTRRDRYYIYREFCFTESAFLSSHLALTVQNSMRYKYSIRVMVFKLKTH